MCDLISLKVKLFMLSKYELRFFMKELMTQMFAKCNWFVL